MMRRTRGRRSRKACDTFIVSRLKTQLKTDSPHTHTHTHASYLDFGVVYQAGNALG